MTENEFTKELHGRGFHVVIPQPGSGVPWGMIDIGDGVMVNRWIGGRTLHDQLNYCIASRSKAEREAASRAASLPDKKLANVVKKISNRVTKKAAKKVAKKGGK